MMNLLSNAIKFTKVGSVTVAAVPNDNEIVVVIPIQALA